MIPAGHYFGGVDDVICASTKRNLEDIFQILEYSPLPLGIYTPIYYPDNGL